MRLLAIHDLDVLVERCQPRHQSLDRKAMELVLGEGRNLGLGDAQTLGRCYLIEPATRVGPLIACARRSLVCRFSASA